MKQFASWFTHGVPGGSALRRQIFEAKRGEEVMHRVDEFFAGHSAPSFVKGVHADSPTESLEPAPAWMG